MPLSHRFAYDYKNASPLGQHTQEKCENVYEKIILIKISRGHNSVYSGRRVAFSRQQLSQWVQPKGGECARQNIADSTVSAIVYCPQNIPVSSIRWHRKSVTLKEKKIMDKVDIVQSSMDVSRDSRISSYLMLLKSIWGRHVASNRQYHSSWKC